MNKLDTEWFAENWRWVIFFSLMSLVIPSFIYHLATLDPELWSKESRKQVKEKFEKEIREIELPSKTAVNKFDSYEKHFSVFVNIRYRTEIGESEFVKNLKDQLEKKDWIYYGRGDSQNYLFVVEKQTQHFILKETGNCSATAETILNYISPSECVRKLILTISVRRVAGR